MHSLGDMDIQRGDEARTSINDSEVEVLNNGNPLISDVTETNTLEKATSGVYISPVRVDNDPEQNDRLNVLMRLRIIENHYLWLGLMCKRPSMSSNMNCCYENCTSMGSLEMIGCWCKIYTAT